MRIDITSFFFNTTIPDATATAAWGTAICIQDKEKTYKIKKKIVIFTRTYCWHQGGCSINAATEKFLKAS